MHLLHNFLSISMSLNGTSFILLDDEIYVIVTQVNDLFSSSNSVPNPLSTPWTIWKSLYASVQCPTEEENAIQLMCAFQFLTYHVHV